MPNTKSFYPLMRDHVQNKKVCKRFFAKTYSEQLGLS